MHKLAFILVATFQVFLSDSDAFFLKQLSLEDV